MDFYQCKQQPRGSDYIREKRGLVSDRAPVILLQYAEQNVANASEFESYQDGQNNVKYCC